MGCLKVVEQFVEQEYQGKTKYSEKAGSSNIFSSQIPWDLICDGTQAASVGSRRLAAWAVARLWSFLCILHFQSIIYNHTTMRRYINYAVDEKSLNNPEGYVYQ